MPGVSEVNSIAAIGQTIDDLQLVAASGHGGEWEDRYPTAIGRQPRRR
jgi:hypothetical protein